MSEAIEKLEPIKIKAQHWERLLLQMQENRNKINEIIEAIALLDKECVWRLYKGRGEWETNCGEIYPVLRDADGDYKSCPNCGGKIVE